MFALLLALAIAPLALAGEAAVSSQPQKPSLILVGFVGGFVRHDNPHQQPVLLAQRMRQSLGPDAYIQVFENRHRHSAYNKIVHLLDRNHDGVLSEEEKSQAQIVLFGHSWGASAAVLLARELNRADIPVLLTVQVDSVAKFWQHDSVIPDNVTAAANFYQPHGLVHGRARITAADSSKTEILGNYRYDYREQPVKCPSMGWFDHLTPSHAQSVCDPHLWSRVEDLVRQRIEPRAGTVATITAGNQPRQ